MRAPDDSRPRSSAPEDGEGERDNGDDVSGDPGIWGSPDVRAIEAFFRRRYGREALYIPSGRLALYVIFREWLRPGDRILMSPVNDDVVFFTALAAGLAPVLGPVHPRTGNLDPAAIPGSTWARLRAVLTTNLYGNPDRMDLLDEQCRRHGLLLLEDACHAFDSGFDGRRIGTFGTAAAFSFSKHLEVGGGVLTFSERERRESLVRRARREVRNQIFSSANLHRWWMLLVGTGVIRRAPRSLASVANRLTPPRVGRIGHRMEYVPQDVVRAQRDGGGLDRFDPWVRVDNPAYRAWAPRMLVRISRRRLESFEENRRHRIDGTGRLLELGYGSPDVALPTDTALLRVPLFSRDREAVIAHLVDRGLGTEYVYDPPLDLYAAELAEIVPSPPSARVWTRDVLPVNPLLADRFIAIVRDSPGIFKPLSQVV